MNFFAVASTITSAATVSPGSCEDSVYWAPTVSNWAEENVDAKLSSWYYNLVPNPPTAIVPGSFPTQLPPPYTGFGNTSNWNAPGLVGQLFSIANQGLDVNCELLDGITTSCPSIELSNACKPF